uniref:Uncharacterized protein n=1 Tax=Zea mays TaxID=4577 RepID=A0A804M916_MAIZE
MEESRRGRGGGGHRRSRRSGGRARSRPRWSRHRPPGRRSASRHWPPSSRAAPRPRAPTGPPRGRGRWTRVLGAATTTSRKRSRGREGNRGGERALDPRAGER